MRYGQYESVHRRPCWGLAAAHRLRCSICVPTLRSIGGFGDVAVAGHWFGASPLGALVTGGSCGPDNGKFYLWLGLVGPELCTGHRPQLEHSFAGAVSGQQMWDDVET